MLQQVAIIVMILVALAVISPLFVEVTLTILSGLGYPQVRLSAKSNHVAKWVNMYV